MPIQLIENSEIDNKIGFGPYSDFFNGLEKEFYFKNFLLNITYSNYKNHEHFRFYSRIDFNEILVPIDNKVDFYSFNGRTKFNDFKRNVKICVSNKNDDLFFLKEDLYYNVLKELCTDFNNCFFEQDLKNESFYFFLSLTNGNFLNKNFDADIYSGLLYDLKNGKISFKFQKLENKFFENCDVVLEKGFFEYYYFLITKNLKNENVTVGFRRIIPSNFIIEDLWKYMLGLLIFSLVFLIGGNIILFFLRKKKRTRKNLGLMEEDYIILKKNLNIR